MNKIFSIFRKIFMKKRAPQERGCWNCKHTNQSYEDLPCCWCDSPELYEWEPKE